MIRFLLIALFALISSHVPASAKDAFSYKEFSALPVQYGGRIIPIDSFARIQLKHLAGRETINGMDAKEWLAEMLFDPASAMERPVFRVLRTDVLGLEPRKGRLYTYPEILTSLRGRGEAIQKTLELDPQSWSEAQKELIEFHEKSMMYGQILRSFSALLPLGLDVPDILKSAWKLEDKPAWTLQDFAPHRRDLEARLLRITERKGGDIARYSEDEKQITAFAFQIQTMESGSEDNIILRILPGASDASIWYSPWESASRGEGSPAALSYLGQWKDMAFAYAAHDSGAWNESAQSARALTSNFVNIEKITYELAYNSLSPLTWAGALYLLAFLFYIAANAGPKPLAFRFVAIAALSIGAAFHTAAIVLRMIILSRPPVGTLYESILFVGIICVLVALLMELKRKDGIGILISTLCGVFLLFLARGFSAENDMGVLVAVLNTNFWLATHVLIITMGYGFCILASMAAHLWLAKKARGKDAHNLTRPINILVTTSLLFTAAGTILGGIWADQSWGRFWGWDPKENGALLIVLWTVWILHGKLAGQINREWYMAGIAALSMIVSLAWFGVNLLATGLHSYGFTSGAAGALFAFFAAETMLISLLLYKACTKRGAV